MEKQHRPIWTHRVKVVDYQQLLEQVEHVEIILKNIVMISLVQTFERSGTFNDVLHSSVKVGFKSNVSYIIYAFSLCVRGTKMTLVHLDGQPPLY